MHRLPLHCRYPKGPWIQGLTAGVLLTIVPLSGIQAQRLGNISAVGFADRDLPFTACTIVQGTGGELDVIILAEAAQDPAVDPVLFLAPVSVRPEDVQNSDLALSNDDFSDNSDEDESFISSSRSCITP